MFHGLVESVCKYGRSLGYLGLRVVALAETRRAEDQITEGLVSSFFKSSYVDTLWSEPFLALKWVWVYQKAAP